MKNKAVPLIGLLMIACEQNLFRCNKDHFTFIEIEIALAVTYFLLNVIFKPDRIEIESDAGSGGFALFDAHIFQINNTYQRVFRRRQGKPAMQFSNGVNDMYVVGSHIRLKKGYRDRKGTVCRYYN